MENKMGTMPMPKLMITMSLPIMISMLVQALYNIVDSMFVARLSQDALAAVSLCYPVQTIMIAISCGTGVGFNTLLSRCLGERNTDKANQVVLHGLMIAPVSYTHLDVYKRQELGATTSIFPSDEITREFLKRQGREKDYVELKADPGATYDDVVEIHLDTLVPLAACPNSPDAIKTIRELEGTKVDQVAIGSCTNSGYEDMMKAAAILKGKTIAPNVSLVVSPGSRQVLLKLIESGALATFIHAGARILESACGPCIGMGPVSYTHLDVYKRQPYIRPRSI